ncbi:extracellular solute-binding protein [bacterium D16-51]|nr:extracellular solute-binding protein [bacterium D16-59]RKI60358.1 extracellular solute-binding protein [bacterium D16-51]
MKKLLSKKLASILLASSMVVGSVSILSGCGSKKDEVVTLDVYSQLANYSGLQTGWIADILMDKFKVKLNIIQEGDGVYETRMESGDLGDIVVWGHDNDKYPNAVKAGLLYDWNEDDLLAEFGPYIKENMPDALKKNQNLTSTITEGERDTLYGFGFNVATSSEDHESFMYTWDIRWDLYKELGYPKIKNLDDYEKLLEDMVNLCPKDDSGNKTYAISLWSEWDDAMVMYVKAFATAYFGYDELGVGLYDPATGVLHGALEENGPYLTILKFFNNLYQKGLVDPDSMTQTYDKMIEKVQNGGTMFSIFNYAGYMAYNKPAHLKDGKGMFSLKPEEASPIVYGMNTAGGERVWTIGAKSEYPELCMEVINYFCTPEGRLTMDYGPKGVCWDYDEEGNTYFTDLGKECNNNKKTKMGEPYKGSFQDGSLQIVNTTWSTDATNPESNGERYNYLSWKSNTAKAESDIEQDWRDKTGAQRVDDYMENTGKYTVAPGTSYSQEQKSTELKTTWSQVTDEIKAASWRAIYAENDSAYDKIVADMIKKCKSYGYEECLKWTENEASRRKALEDAITK